MDLSVVIVNFNTKDLLLRCLDSIFSSTMDIEFEVVVVDNGSTDGSVEALRKRFPAAKVLENKENLGFAKANNQGIRASKGRYVLLLNSDTEVRDDALERMVKFMDNNGQVEDPERSRRIGVLGPKLVFPDGRVQKECSALPSLLPMIMWQFKLHRVWPFPKLPPLRNFMLADMNYDEIQEVPKVMGSAFLMRREVVDQIGLLDEGFWFWFEETDYCKRAKDAGWKVVYYPEAEIIHYVGETASKISYLKRQAIWNRSLRYYFKKHKSFLERIALEPFIYLSFAVSALLDLKSAFHSK